MFLPRVLSYTEHRSQFPPVHQFSPKNSNIYISVTYKVTMITEIPPAALRAYALFYGKYRTAPFQQSALDWVVGTAMRKKIFATLLRAGWIQKSTRMRYTCRKPDTVIGGLLEFRVPTAIRQAERPYAFTGLSSIELWSDFCYIHRSRERSPYFMKIVRK